MIYSFDGETLNGLIRGELSTLDLFEMEHELSVLTVKVKCPMCHHVWGIRCDEYESLISIPRRKFICTNCSM
jgi:hypothetical protein